MGTATTAASQGGVGALLRLRPFRVLLVANVMSAIAFGTSRFVYVWLVGELTDWNPATAILGIVIGIPPLALSAWAGSLADQFSPRKLATTLFAISGFGFAVTGVLVATDAMTVRIAMVCGFLTVAAPSMLIPLMQALVPTVTPADQLMPAVALQNLSMMVSVMGGVFLGGAVMQLFGTEAGFWLLVVACALGWLLASGSALPDRLLGASATRGSIRDGFRVALGTEPLRSLLAITAVMGIAITASVLLLPELARDILESESLAASALNVTMSVGMMITSLLLATRWRPTRPGFILTLFSTFTLGGGLIAIGLSRRYIVTALCCLGWGLCGGVAMTLLRTLIQKNTPHELMGRVMGLSAMAQNGAFPIAALMLFGLVAIAGVTGAMVITGLICCALCGLVAIRPTVRDLT
jgi:MFS transporter, DHA3 family, macrolide efflux protein